MALNANVMAALLPFIREDASLAFDPAELRQQLGVLIGSAGAGGAIGALLLGPMVDKYGRRPLMVWGLLAFVLGSAVHLLARDHQELVFARALTGFAAGVVYSSASAALGDLIPYERRGKAMGIFAAGMFLALPLGLPLAQLLAEYADWWRGIYAVQTVVGVLSLLAIRAYLPRDRGAGQRFMRNLPTLGRPEVLACLLSVMLYVGAFFTTIQYSGDWMDESGLMPKAEQWKVWALLGLCSAAGSAVFGRVADHIGKRSWTLISTLSVAVCVYLLGGVGGIWGLVGVGLPLALISASRTGPLQALISELVPREARGTLMGIRSAAVNLGTGVFPMLAAGTFAEVTLVGAVGIFVSFLLVLLFVRQR